MTRKTQHVIKSFNGGWAVKKEGSTRATKVYNTQREAIDHGRMIAREQKTDFYIHREDGRVRDKNSYAEDQNPPKNKK